MNNEIIALHRIKNQYIACTDQAAPADLVAHMGAMQAQDASMIKWAVGSRLSDAQNKSVEKALDDGLILRTHTLRPTWHIVEASDLKWMQALTSPQVKMAVAPRDKNLDLDDTIFNKCNDIIGNALSNGNHRTRSEISEIIERTGIPMDSHRIAHVMMRAELDALVCSGKKQGKEQTYALVDERVPISKILMRDEALAELARRYFISHGPATLADFVWWSGLRIKDARQGLEEVKSQLISEKWNGQEYWFSNSLQIPTLDKSQAYFLAAFDEFVISYKDRSAVLHADWNAHAISSNGIFKPIIVLDGQVIGTWKRSLKKEAVLIETKLFKPLQVEEQEILENAAQQYADFEGKGLTLVLK